MFLDFQQVVMRLNLLSDATEQFFDIERLFEQADSPQLDDFLHEFGLLGRGDENNRCSIRFGMRRKVLPVGSHCPPAAKCPAGSKSGLIARAWLAPGDRIRRDGGVVTIAFESNNQGHGDFLIVFDNEYFFYFVIPPLVECLGLDRQGPEMAASSFSMSNGFSKKPAAFIVLAFSLRFFSLPAVMKMIGMSASPASSNSRATSKPLPMGMKTSMRIRSGFQMIARRKLRTPSGTICTS